MSFANSQLPKAPPQNLQVSPHTSRNQTECAPASKPEIYLWRNLQVLWRESRCISFHKPPTIRQPSQRRLQVDTLRRLSFSLVECKNCCGETCRKQAKSAPRFSACFLHVFLLFLVTFNIVTLSTPLNFEQKIDDVDDFGIDFDVKFW